MLLTFWQFDLHWYYVFQSFDDKYLIIYFFSGTLTKVIKVQQQQGGVPDPVVVEYIFLLLLWVIEPIYW